MISNELRIREFSTGIKPQRAQHPQRWISGGFTGEFMNMTDEVPSRIRSEISQKLFAISEGSHSETPAVIGRVVQDGAHAWSVIAVVTRGEDNFGRFFSAYRYFWLPGPDQLWRIIHWLSIHQLPTFNPYDDRYNDDNFYDCRFPKFSKKTFLLPGDVMPARSLIWYACYPLYGEQHELLGVNLQKINELAERLGFPIAWAFNVNALELPSTFKLIKPASEAGFRWIENSLEQQQHYNALPPARTGIDSDVEVAIRRLQGSNVNHQTLEILEKALTQEDEGFWEKVFNYRFAADKAFNDQNYLGQYVRLLTLRAIVLPNSLADFLKWLGTKNQDASGYKTPVQESLNLQDAIAQAIQSRKEVFPNLRLKIREGTVLLILHQLKHRLDTFNPDVLWAFRERKTLWSHYSHYLSQEILDVFRVNQAPYPVSEEELSQVKQTAREQSFFKTVPEWLKLLERLEQYGQAPCPPLDRQRDRRSYQKLRLELEKKLNIAATVTPDEPNSIYRSLAQLFEKLGKSSKEEYFQGNPYADHLAVAGILWQISAGGVPNDLFRYLLRIQPEEEFLARQLPATKFILLNQAVLKQFENRHKQAHFFRSVFTWVIPVLPLAKGVTNLKQWILEDEVDCKKAQPQSKSVPIEHRIFQIAVLVFLSLAALIVWQVVQQLEIPLRRIVPAEPDLERAIKQLPTTQDSLKTIAGQTGAPEKSRKEMKALFNLDFDKPWEPQNENQKRSLIQGIRQYQTNKGLYPDGVMGDETRRTLRCELVFRISPTKEVDENCYVEKLFAQFDQRAKPLLLDTQKQVVTDTQKQDSDIRFVLRSVLEQPLSSQNLSSLSDDDLRKLQQSSLDAPTKREWSQALYDYFKNSPQPDLVKAFTAESLSGKTSEKTKRLLFCSALENMRTSNSIDDSQAQQLCPPAPPSQ